MAALEQTGTDRKNASGTGVETHGIVPERLALTSDGWLLGRGEDIGTVEWTAGLSREPAPLDFNEDGSIAARIYDQDGAFVPLRYANTVENEVFVRWLRRHDRYTPRAATAGE